MQTTFSFNYFGSIIKAKSLGVSFIPNLNETLSSHCMPFTKEGKIVAVNIIGRGVDIPGGHIDNNETAIEAMSREASEEAQITISNPRLIDVWRLSSKDIKLGLTEKPYLLLYSTEVVSMKKFIPNEEADNRLILDPEEFIIKYFGDKQLARAMVDKSLPMFK